MIETNAVRAAVSRKALTLEIAPRAMTLRPGMPATSAWRFAGETIPRFLQSDEVDVGITNRLPVPVSIIWRGLNGVPAVEPLLTRDPIAAGGSQKFALDLKHAGTLLCDARLQSAGSPLPVLPIVVSETAAPTVDHDEVLLIEDWRLRADGSAMPPGSEANADPVYTINGKPLWSFQAFIGGRLRLRLINGAQRSVIAVQMPDLDVRVIAIDGQPSEPFPAREGRLVMAPGTRIDVVIDVAKSSSDLMLRDGTRTIKIGEIVAKSAPSQATPRPPLMALPSNGLPDRLNLQSALRIDLKTDASSGWFAPSGLSPTMPPAFRVARNRTVVIAVTNPGDSPCVFHLHGHHMRLLDRLDDGWKPFWLDTLAIPGKQTVRLAFAATVAGKYLMEMSGTEWSSAKLLQTYAVET